MADLATTDIGEGWLRLQAMEVCRRLEIRAADGQVVAVVRAVGQTWLQVVAIAEAARGPFTAVAMGVA